MDNYSNNKNFDYNVFLTRDSLNVIFHERWKIDEKRKRKFEKTWKLYSYNSNTMLCKLKREIITINNKLKILNEKFKIMIL